MRLAKRRKVHPGDPMAVVSRFLDAANHHDSDTLYATVHPEFESFQPLHPDRNFRGPGQLISNWKAIFEAEPGFRLTVLRASTTGNTVWVELHGAGESAEAAGIFIVGVENGRIRWVRVYSDLVDGVAPEWDTEVPAAAADGATGTEQLADAAAGDADTDAAAAAVAADTESPGGDGEDGDGSDREAHTAVVGSGALRLVDSGEDAGPETRPDPETPADVGLHLVDPAVAGPDDGRQGQVDDEGPVETLVGPSRIVAPTPSEEAADPSGGDLWLPDRSDDHPAGSAERGTAEVSDISDGAVPVDASAEAEAGIESTDGDQATGDAGDPPAAGSATPLRGPLGPEILESEAAGTDAGDTEAGDTEAGESVTGDPEVGETEVADTEAAESDPSVSDATDGDGDADATASGVDPEPQGATSSESDEKVEAPGATDARSYDSLPREPRRSRWRRALRKF